MQPVEAASASSDAVPSIVASQHRVEPHCGLAPFPQEVGRGPEDAYDDGPASHLWNSGAFVVGASYISCSSRGWARYVIVTDFINGIIFLSNKPMRL